MSTDVIKQLASEWRTAGVQEGDMLLVHSNIKRTLRRIAKMGGEVNPRIVIKSFLDVIGESGTLLLPLFNFDFPRGVTFDIRNTPSHMGALTEMGRLWPGAVRTGHPIYSFAAIGNKAYMFKGLANYSGYGEDSPFGVLHRNGGKIGVLDLTDQESMTFYHYVEERLNAPYRYHKVFTGQYIDIDGTETSRSFGLFVRNIEEGVVTYVNPMGEILWKKGLFSGYRPNEECGLRVISAQKLFDEVADVLNNNRAKGILYEIE